MVMRVCALLAGHEQGCGMVGTDAVMAGFGGGRPGTGGF
jgi:hypothetical protein